MTSVMASAADTVVDHVDDLSNVSPELVLVDPELSRRLRLHLPLPFLRRRRPPLPVLRLVHEAAEPLE